MSKEREKYVAEKAYERGRRERRTNLQTALLTICSIIGGKPRRAVGSKSYRNGKAIVASGGDAALFKNQRSGQVKLAGFFLGL